MKVVASCFECLDKGIEKFIESGTSLVNYDDELCFYKCKEGHESYMWLQNNKFELLYDSAIISLYEEYFRETILNLSSTLENFFEYVIKLILFSKKNMTSEDITKFYSNISRRSECREGTFYGICKIYLDEEYIVSEKYKKLRNDVIHNGKFPREEETIEFAKYVYQFICECYKKIQHILGLEKIREYSFMEQKRIILKHNRQFSSSLLPTMLSQGFRGISFEESLDNFKENINYCYKSPIKNSN